MLLAVLSFEDSVVSEAIASVGGAGLRREDEVAFSIWRLV